MPRQDSTTFLQQLSQANIRDGGAVIDTTNFNVTVIQPLLHSTIPGDNVIDGGLTKRGNGTLTLSGAGSSYTGPTVITGGTLSVVAGAVGSLNCSSTVHDGRAGGISGTRAEPSTSRLLPRVAEPIQLLCSKFDRKSGRH